MDYIRQSVVEQFVETSLFDALEKCLNPEFESISRVVSSAFGRNSNGQEGLGNRFIGKGKKIPSKNKILSFEIAYDEKHVLIYKKVDIKWIKSMEQLNFIEKEPKIIWWFGKANYDLKDEILELLGEFRTFHISDDINPKVLFYIETKRRVLFE